LVPEVSGEVTVPPIADAEVDLSVTAGSTSRRVFEVAVDASSIFGPEVVSLVTALTGAALALEE
jgi:hypothetical protein